MSSERIKKLRDTINKLNDEDFFDFLYEFSSCRNCVYETASTECSTHTCYTGIKQWYFEEK